MAFDDDDDLLDEEESDFFSAPPPPPPPPPPPTPLTYDDTDNVEQIALRRKCQTQYLLCNPTRFLTTLCDYVAFQAVDLTSHPSYPEKKKARELVSKMISNLFQVLTLLWIFLNYYILFMLPSSSAAVPNFARFDPYAPENKTSPIQDIPGYNAFFFFFYLTFASLSFVLNTLRERFARLEEKSIMTIVLFASVVFLFRDFLTTQTAGNMLTYNLPLQSKKTFVIFAIAATAFFQYMLNHQYPTTQEWIFSPVESAKRIWNKATTPVYYSYLLWVILGILATILWIPFGGSLSIYILLLYAYFGPLIHPSEHFARAFSNLSSPTTTIDNDDTNNFLPFLDWLRPLAHFLSSHIFSLSISTAFLYNLFLSLSLKIPRLQILSIILNTIGLVLSITIMS